MCPRTEAGEAGQEAKRQAKSFGQSLRDMGEEASSTAKEKLGQLRESASEYYDEGRDRVLKMKENAEHYIQEYPGRSVLIAAAVGILVGFLFKRTRTVERY